MSRCGCGIRFNDVGIILKLPLNCYFEIVKCTKCFKIIMTKRYL